jgi:hypothetical protein
LTVTLSIFAALPPFARAGQAVNDVLNFGISGTVSPSTPSHRNPLHTLGRRSVQAMLLELAKMPRKRDFVEKALIGLKVSVADLAFWLEKHLRLHAVLPLLKAKDE